MMDDLLKNLSESAKTALEKAGVKFEELKHLSAEKFAELSEKALLGLGQRPQLAQVLVQVGAEVVRCGQEPLVEFLARHARRGMSNLKRAGTSLGR